MINRCRLSLLLVNFILAFIGISFDAITAFGSETFLPVVSPSDFSVGTAWTWDYVDQTGAPWSTERYTVISQNGSTVLLEISSDYGAGHSLKPNTRLEVDVAKCLNAYSNPAQKKPWSFKMYSLSGASWTEYSAPSTLAFEEKFNCNPREYLKASAPYLTVYSEIGGLRVFQQKLWRKILSSWFALDGPSAGVAISKDFSADPRMTYRFHLRSQSL
jgi:hypothetical protein